MEKGKYTIIQYLLGIIFILSGVTKILSIDEFQIFIYSLKILNLNYSMLLTRVIIGVELSLGLLYLMKIHSKPILYFTLWLMTIFTLFTLYLEITNITEDCHCFGSFIQLSNTTTIIKNGIIMIMIIYLLTNKYVGLIKKKSLYISFCFIFGFGVLMVVRPPDFIYTINYSEKSLYYKPGLRKFILNNKLTDKKQIICFFSHDCKYCKFAAKKISIIAEGTKKNKNNDILYVFWDTNKTANHFFKETNTKSFNFINLNVVEFLKLTNGTMPLIILYNKGVVEKVFRYNDIDESQIIEFLDK